MEETRHSEKKGLALTYPLRTDFMVQVVIPRDLTTLEFKRLSAFLATLVSDQTL